LLQRTTKPSKASAGAGRIAPLRRAVEEVGLARPVRPLEPRRVEQGHAGHGEHGAVAGAQHDGCAAPSGRASEPCDRFLLERRVEREDDVAADARALEQVVGGALDQPAP
jgi:hypothetical protein